MSKNVHNKLSFMKKVSFIKMIYARNKRNKAHVFRHQRQVATNSA